MATPPPSAQRAGRRVRRSARGAPSQPGRRPPGGAAPSAPGTAPLPTPELLKRLEFRVLRRLDGFLFGDVGGLFYGPSLDLAEVREYQPGDEVRRIDWHVTARTGTVHVRQYREEREIRGWLVVDRTASMAFGTRRSLKSEVARDFAVTAASVLSRQGNKVAALAFDEHGTRVVRPGNGRLQVLRVLDGLTGESAERSEGARAGRSAERRRALDRAGSAPSSAATTAATAGAPADPLAAALARLERSVRRRSLVFVVSDFLAADAGEPAREPAWARPLGRVAARHDVIAVRISDPAEHALPDVGELRVRDPESGRELWLDTSDARVRRAHAELVEARERMLKRVLRSSGADVLQLSTAHDIVRPLLAFVRRRKARRRDGARP